MAPRSCSRVKIVSPNTGTVNHSRSISIVPSSTASTDTSNELECDSRHQVPSLFLKSNEFRIAQHPPSSVVSTLPFQPPKPLFRVMTEPLCDRYPEVKAHHLNSLRRSSRDHLQTSCRVLQHGKGVVQADNRDIQKNCTKIFQRCHLDNASDITHPFVTDENSLNDRWQSQPQSVDIHNSRAKAGRALQLPRTIPIHYDGYDSSQSRGQMSSSSVSMTSRKRHRSYSAISNLDDRDNIGFEAVEEGESEWKGGNQGISLQRHFRSAASKSQSKDQRGCQDMQNVSNAFNDPPLIQDQELNETTSISVGPAMFRGLSSIHVTEELFDTKGCISFARAAPRGILTSRSGTHALSYRDGEYMATVSSKKNSAHRVALIHSLCTRYCSRPLWSLVGTFKTPITSVVDVDYVQGCMRWKQRNPKGGFQMIRIPLDGIQDSVVAHITQEDEDIQEKQFTAIIRTSTRPSQVIFGFKTLSEAKQICSMLKKA
ncbi:unnamed protein product [Phytomonas sp. EM1]|nr:unnamed protein product [Phytomonas sp. EM1]|eukprot:CCW61130.1 unnamed protein product [Phytomonas sp. isolate EM1]